MNDIWGIVLGAVLAVGGGAANGEISSWRDRRRERKAICISISDELTEISQILNNIKTVWEATNTLIPSHIKELKACTSTYDMLRHRLFLIKNESTRKQIATFYRDLKSAVNSNANRAGSLSKSEDAKQKQEEIANKFIGFISRLETIQAKIQ